TSVFKKIQATLKLYGYTLSTPIGEISAEVLELLLFGKNKTTEDPYNLKLADLLIEKIGGHKKEEEAIILEQCPACQGRRLHCMALHFKILGKNIAELCEMNLTSLQTWCQDLPKNLPSRQRQISQQIGDEIGKRIRLLIDIGLHYLHLGKSLRGLSSGEIRRIRIAKQIGTQNSHLRGVTYILDEPSLALHPRDNERIIQGLKKLRDRGNTVIVIEHDADIIEMADHLIELGPGAGRCGGEIIAKGAPKDFLEKQTPTALLLKEREQPSPIKRKRRKATGGVIAMTGCSGFPLKNINPSFPLGTLIAITGVSASGKSTLFKTLAMAIKTTLKQKTKPGFPYKKIIGAETINQVIEVSQNTISRSKRSNIATYIQLFNLIRNLFAEIPEAKIRGYKPRHFSFNTKGGRCEECKGMGDQSVDFEAMPGTKIRCEVCEGKGYQEEILGVRYKGKSIYDVLQMNVAEGVTFFKHHPYILKKLSTLMEVGLGYIQIGQDANSLSGGEAQRVKLARELSKKPKGRVLYMFDEPTANLHAQDVALLVNTMQQLVDKGNTIVCIEHNLDLIKVSDYVIDLGPEAAERGGSIVAQGTPEEVAKISKSHTGRFLKKLLGK
ncbi:MAG: ATP-binding cassette domain-containing protein, partial [Cytophagales bacterium]